MNDPSSLSSLLQRFRTLQLLVAGDLMLDEYLWCGMDRISPEAPCPVVDLVRTDRITGGAGNVARNAAHLGAKVRLLGVLGDDGPGRAVLQDLAPLADTASVLSDPDRPTTVKTRILARSNHILRIDHESRKDIPPALEERVDALLSAMNRPDAVVISDYGKGFLTDRVIRAILDRAAAWNVPSVVDPKGEEYAKYRGCTVITPNRKEAELATRVAIDAPERVVEAARRLQEITGSQGVVITRGAEGMSVLAERGVVDIPTEAREVYDVTGAGDTVCSVIALGLASGLGLSDAARLANSAAGVVVEKVGTSWVTPAELLERSDRSRYAKVQDAEQLRMTVSRLKALGKRIVFTNGCFDILHVGHVKYLTAARALGDVLIVGLNSDRSVRELKGEKRPIIGQDDRAHMLAGVDGVDLITVFDELTPDALIRLVRPDVLVKGGDYTVDRVVGRDIVEAYGGRVAIVPFEPGASTTNIVQTIVDRYSGGAGPA